MRLSFLLVLFALVSCQQQGINKEELFDVPDYFENEFKQVNQQFTKLNKTFLYDNKQDSVLLDSFNLEKELHDFLELDLNKAAYVGAFKQIETQLDSGSVLLVYESTQKGIDLSKIEILFYNDEVKSLRFIFEESNNLYESGKELFYQTNRGFVISGFQRTKFKDPAKYKIEGRYLQ
jgi:hypothetical protein